MAEPRKNYGRKRVSRRSQKPRGTTVQERLDLILRFDAGVLTTEKRYAIIEKIMTAFTDTGTPAPQSRDAPADTDAAQNARRKAFEEAAEIAYRTCAETRHVKLGDACAAAIRQCAEEGN
ncbi:hypothetical protein [Sinorhizobium meliloti]|uniref:hypothetical protein n=1 Tax=Rhizobium meliloti TaxID=382 RepID=UPI001297BDEC|nr:hypothetical protein [Sinorhizobium meliloti]MDW9491718.1 hypothetical protein [Sinorhizobium meliloti]MQV02984.1 hypothetical protein [Sinorhizobium meliloti]